jgi:uncharacterized delta-60 repeat protein
MQSVSENYITVINAPNGLFVRSGAGSSNLWVNNDYAVIENGQKFIASGQTQIQNGVLWYQIHVPTNVKTSVNGTSAQYGWISGQYVTYSGCNFPQTPAIATASSTSSNSFKANWNYSTNSSSYLLDVSTNSSFTNFVSPYSNFNVGNVNSYNVTGLNSNTTYYYRIRGNNNCGQSGNSTYSTCTTSNPCITQPGAFTLNTPTGADISNGSIRLSWTPSANASSYVICSATTNCPTATNVLNTVNASTLSYTANGLAPGTSYKFIVIAKNGSCVANSNCVTAVTLGGCVPLTIIPQPSLQPVLPGATAQLTVSVSGTSPVYQWQESIDNGNSWRDIHNNTTYSGAKMASLSIAGVTGLMNNNKYRCKLSNFCTSNLFSSTSTLIVNTALTPSITIDNNLSQIPPWQRAKDDLEGSIYVNFNNLPPNSTLRVDIYQDGQKIDQTPEWNTSATTGSHRFNFQLSMPNTYKGGRVGYQIFCSPSIYRDASDFTNIIESKWDKINLIYWNAPGHQFQIPVKYYHNTNTVKIEFEREASTSSPCGILSFNLNPCASNRKDVLTTQSITQGSNSQFFTFNQDNDYSNNLRTLTPGIFTYTMQYLDANGVSIVPEEKGKFELTKFGKYGNSQSDTVIVYIAGIWNNLEKRIEEIKLSPSAYSQESSTEPYSIIEYIKNYTGYQTWYIAQPNGNFAQRNAHDIGLSLDSIIKIVQVNNPNPKIILICHSKGGIDVRAMLADMSCSYKNHLSESRDPLKLEYDELSNFKYKGSALDGKLKKILFLATPHNGGKPRDELGNIITSFDSPALKEMLKRTNFEVINELNINTKGTIPLNIEVANMTAYYSFLSGSLDYYQSSLSSFANLMYTNTFHDGQVDVESSDFVSTTNGNPLKYTDSTIVPVIQMYQDDDVLPLNFPHTTIHTNKCLSTVKSATHEEINGILPFNNNLDKIIHFITSSANIVSCTRPEISNFRIEPNSSVLPGAIVQFKTNTDTSYTFLGITDENGYLNIKKIPKFQLGDSILIEAAGKQFTKIVIDSTIANNSAINISLLHANPTNKIAYPILSLENNSPLTNINTVTLNISANNLHRVEMNIPINQDSLYNEIIPINNKYILTLDTGYNRVIVKYISLVDTVTLSKELYYYPDTDWESNTTNLAIQSNIAFLGAKIFIDQLYYTFVKSNFSVVRIPASSREIKFSLIGYKDTTFLIDNQSVINLFLERMNYNSEIDSSIIDFDQNGMLQYWKNITIKKIDSVTNSGLILKQNEYNNYPDGLAPLSRGFNFRNISTNGFPVLQTAICLDQAEQISRDSSYLLVTKDDSIYTKLLFDSTRCDFDSLVQKLTYNNFDFDSGQVSTEEIRIMKKLKPIVFNKSFSISQNDSLTIPIKQIVNDPDSINDDISILIDSIGPGITVTLNQNVLKIQSASCFAGTTYFQIKAEHDGLIAYSTISLEIGPPPAANSSGTTCTGGEINLHANGGVNYSWTGPMGFQSSLQNPTISNATTLNSGVYTVAVTMSNGCINSVNVNVSVDQELVSVPGSADLNFNIGTGFNGSNSSVNATIIQSDGKIIIGGLFNSFNGSPYNNIIRLNPDGSIDTTFHIGTGFNDEVTSIALQNNGQIIIGGVFTSYNGTIQNRLIRINSDGSIDNSFVIGQGFNGSVSSIAIQSDQKILVVGSFTQYKGSNFYRIIRLLTDGSIDSNNDFHPYAGFNDTAQTVILQPDGKILVAGCFTQFNGYTRNRICRINTDGSIDQTFDPGTGFDNSVLTLALQEDGKILSGGQFNSYNGVNQKRIVRISPDGLTDNTFSTGNGFNDIVKSILIEQNDKILVGGNSTTYNNIPINRLARLNSDGSIDTTFSLGSGFNDQVNCLIQQQNSLIVAGGKFSTLNGSSRNRICRINNNQIFITSIDPPAPYCVGSELTVSFTAFGSFPCNLFTVQLSSSTGDFQNPVNIGSLSSSTSGNISALIPPGILPGTAYRLRVTSSSPKFVSFDNGFNIIFKSQPTATISSSTSICSGDTLKLQASGGSQYLWTGPNGFTSTIQNPVIPNAASVNDGTYNVIVTDTNFGWIRRADFPGFIRADAMGFGILNKGYMGTGVNTNLSYYFHDTYIYDPTSDSWNYGASVGNGGGFDMGVGFGIGNMGYFGTGNNQGAVKEFWKYDPLINNWTRKADVGGNPRINAIGFSIGTKGYVGIGQCDYSNYCNDFWEYNPSTDGWTQKANFPNSMTRSAAVGFSISTKGYVGLGSDGSGNFKDFWEYDPIFDTWTRKADFPGAERVNAVSFNLGNKGYVGLGGGGGALYNDFWEYDPALDTWKQIDDFGGGPRHSATAFTVEDKGFVGTGSDGTNYKNDLWEYSARSTCSANDSIIVKVNSGNIFATSNSPVCVNGTLEFIATGTGPFSWTGPNGFSSSLQNPEIPNVSIADSGTYYVSVANNNGCPEIKVPVLVQINENPVVLPVLNHVTCHGETNGSIFIDTTNLGGKAPYHILWNTGDTTYQLSGLSEGAYTVLVADSNQCYSDSTIAINEPNLVTTAFSSFSEFPSGHNVSCNGAADGVIALEVDGGTSPYSFSWNNGLFMTKDLNNIPAGTYKIVVTDSLGCSATDSINLTEPDNINLALSSITSNGFNIACQGEASGIISVELTGGISPFEFSWTGPNGYTNTDSSIVNLQAGLYTLVVTDAAGCFNTDSIELTESGIASPLIQSAWINTVDAHCFNGNDGYAYIDTVLGGTPPYQFLWSNGVTDKFLYNLSSGSYSVNITDSNGCKINASLFISQPDPIQAAMHTSDYNGYGISCQGLSDGFVILDSIYDGYAPYNFTWSTGSSTDSIGGLFTGSYYLTVTDANSCIDTFFVELSEPTLPHCQLILNLKLFIEGYYITQDTMRAVSSPFVDPGICDTVSVSIHDSEPPYSLIYKTSGVISINGTGEFMFPRTLLGNDYYIAIDHKNTLQTWSEEPLSFNDTIISYDFSNSPYKAYGKNMQYLGDGNYALYSGDVNQDGIIDWLDLVELEMSMQQFYWGFHVDDLTGDWLIESADFSLIENNIGRFVLRP